MSPYVMDPGTPDIWNPTQLLCLMCPNRRWLPAPSGMQRRWLGNLPLLSLLLPLAAFPAWLQHWGPGCFREQLWEKQVLLRAHLAPGQGKGNKLRMGKHWQWGWEGSQAEMYNTFPLLGLTGS